MRHRPVLITGGVCFMGSHIVERLLADVWRVKVVDDFDRFYNAAVKRARMVKTLIGSL